MEQNGGSRNQHIQQIIFILTHIYFYFVYFFVHVHGCHGVKLEVGGQTVIVGFHSILWVPEI